MTALRGCDIILWERNIPKIIDFRSDTLRSVGGKTRFANDVQVQDTLKSVSVAKVSSQQCNTLSQHRLQDVVEKLPLKPHRGENHLVCYSLLFTVYFHSAIITQNQKMWRTHAYNPGGEIFLLSEWIAQHFRNHLQVKLHFSPLWNKSSFVIFDFCPLFIIYLLFNSLFCAFDF